MDRRGPILILTASAGAGHLMAAQAIAEALRGRLADRDVEVIDVLERSTGLFRTVYARGYVVMVNRLPSLMGYLYRVTDRPGSGLAERARVGFQQLSNRRLVRDLLRRPPALIINTHFLPAEIVARLRKSRRLDCPQFVVTTDFETHRIWMQEPAERYYTATRRGKAYLCRCGVEAERVSVTGIPVRRGFQARADRDGIRRREGLDRERPVVLLLCGGFGVGPTRSLFRQLLAIDDDVQIVAIAGRNEPMRRDLDELASVSRKSVRVIGYTDRICDWMAAADLLISKPGGLTASEALAAGLPIVIVNPIPGPELRNSDYLLEKGAAVKVNNVAMLSQTVVGLLRNRPRLEALRQTALRIARPGAAERIADDAIDLLGEGG